MSEPTSESQKPRWPRRAALAVAEELRAILAPFCHRIVVAGSLRRGRPEVGDVELVYVSRSEKRQLPGDMFEWRDVALADVEIATMQAVGLLDRRLNVRGAVTYGPKNKLMLHRPTGMPVDLFATTEEAWWNYLVCRTGPAESNVRICEAAIRKGWHWNPYSVGFTTPAGVRRADSEQDVFDLVGLPYLKPEDRR